MKCPRCQHENEAGAKFCEECAVPLARTCGNCGRQLSPTAKFCPECAHPARLAPEAPTAPRFTSPESYTPKHLAERIVNSKAALEGERKQVTVLFADLKGSMELLADRDPEEARKLLDPVLERMMEAVHRYEGTVNQVMGDGIMALFGAPLAHEDHAVRACYAALDMQAAIRRYADEVWRAHGIKAQIRVGLNSGEVVVRAIDSDLHVDYTAVGQTTHLAARMEQLATPGTVLLTADTLRLAEGYVTVKPLGPVPVKGLEAAIEVYELTGAGPLRSRLHAAAARGLTRFVGREGELEQLREALGRASDGHGQVVAIVGEPGVGKSRLVWEVIHSHRVHGWLLLQAGSVSYGKASSYLPVVDLLKRYFAIEDRDSPRAVREKVTGKLLTLDRALESGLPALLSLLDVPTDDPHWQTLDPPQRRRHTLDAVKRLLLRESQAQPLLVVFEDLHWIDSETQGLLDGLVESLPAARLLLLVNYRPEYQYPWGSRTSCTLLRLDPLPPESAEELLGALLGADAGLDPLKRLLIARTEGNPFFLEESVRTLVETQVLVGERGAYRLAKPLPGVQVPATVQAVLAARIDRLPPEDKALLQTASVVGKDVPFVLLQGIAEQAEDELRVAIGRLQAAEFLYEARLFPDIEYSFKHALTHEVAYGSLLQDHRRTLHGRIVEAMEGLYADRLAEQVERLANHAFRGEVWAKAARYLRQAGARAAARSAHREAVGLFEGALTAVRHLPETRETLEGAIDLRFDLRASLTPLGEHERVFEYLREAERLCESLDDQRRLGQVYDHMSYYFFINGRLADARSFGQQAHAIAETLGDLPLQVTASFELGVAAVASGDYVGGEQFFRRVVQLLAGDLSRERFGQAGFPAVLSRSWLALSLAERGEFCEGITHGQEGVRIAEAVAQPYSLIAACLRLGSLYGVKGEYPQAIRLLERGLALSREWNIPIYAPPVSSSLGHVYALSGHIPEGLLLLEQASTTYEAMGVRVLNSLGVARLGEAYLLADRIEDARACADRALMVARERGARGDEAYALRLLGEITSRGDPSDLETADTHYHQAMALGEALGMRPLVARCHLDLGKLARRTGNRARAMEHLTTATAMYREMDMQFWLEQAGAEMMALA
ncbi:MAG TPA: adenylate/guanylate cyclase domain-containing protein [Candidatus Methylomirabilis sp.]|nr:adenylate/guanylate cyclase domain-containing protein [Candidatus Methylomirabilis sp.]